MPRRLGGLRLFRGHRHRHSRPSDFLVFDVRADSANTALRRRMPAEGSVVHPA
ncbi:hypothetical protein Pd630_LPD09130 (plasmid) [Rhodococcus opacus PD630]|nr:hypothetical protein Pd630_LPD09130 [Rhodococcus opacus PD630]